MRESIILNIMYLCTVSTFTSWIIESDENHKQTLRIKTLDFEGNDIVDFGEFYYGNNSRNYRTKGATGGIIFPYDPGPDFADDISQELLFYCMTGEYKIYVYNRSGKVVRVIDRPYDPLPVTDEDMENWRSKFKRELNPMMKKLVYDSEFPKEKPAVRGLKIDEDGNLWAGTYDIKKENGIEYRSFDIFSPEGIYDARIWIKTGLFPGVTKNRKMYTRIIDKETGLSLFKRYKMTWKN